ncbi:hypothetical protein TA3x_000489 [Tundrisphaera sp. TA3]|uniref:hypothetical protein n=1 Tax=Tundrisphaera sp. TA3 TaxID=3435775 RepID=UPI003EB6DE42
MNLSPDQINGLARKTDDKKMSMVLTGISVAMVAMMALKEFHGLMREVNRQEWDEMHRERGRGR